MLTDSEISLIVLFKGLHFSSKITGLDRQKVLQICIENPCPVIFIEIRKELLSLISEKGERFMMDKFCINYDILKSLIEYGQDPKNLKEEEFNYYDQSLVTSWNFLSTFHRPKDKNNYIINKTSALSKAFLVREAEKQSTRYAICEKYGIDRVSLKEWTYSFHQTGQLKGSNIRFKKASSIFQQAYDELCSEIVID